MQVASRALIGRARLHFAAGIEHTGIAKTEIINKHMDLQID